MAPIEKHYALLYNRSNGRRRYNSLQGLGHLPPDNATALRIRHSTGSHQSCRRQTGCPVSALPRSSQNISIKTRGQKSAVHLYETSFLASGPRVTGTHPRGQSSFRTVAASRSTPCVLPRPKTDPSRNRSTQSDERSAQNHSQEKVLMKSAGHRNGLHAHWKLRTTRSDFPAFAFRPALFAVTCFGSTWLRVRISSCGFARE